MRRNKMNADLMVKERMDGAEREIARMKKNMERDKAKAMQDIEDYRRKTNESTNSAPRTSLSSRNFPPRSGTIPPFMPILIPRRRTWTSWKTPSSVPCAAV